MNTIADILPSLTYHHRPDRDYEISGDGEQHIVQSPIFETPCAFQSLVLSVDYHPRAGESLLTEMQICQGGVWSRFFKLGFYTAGKKCSFAEQTDEFGSVFVDMLQSARAAQQYRFRLTITGQADIPSVYVCVFPFEQKTDPILNVLPNGKRFIKVKPISQMKLDVPPAMQRRLCSPTSLTMALNALGVKSKPLDVAQAVYDSHAEIYGNWSFNTAYACERGLEACVTRFKRLSQLEKYITPDSLVLATIGYGAGELTDAAIEQTTGHLVVVCGWEKEWIRVADPAAMHKGDVLRFYNAQEFARVWLENKNGAAYLVRKK